MLSRVATSLGRHAALRSAPRGLAMVAKCPSQAHRLPAAQKIARSLSTAPDDDVDVDGVAYGFMASQALFTGLESGVFDAIAAAGDGGLDLAALQSAAGISAPRLQTLLTSLVGIKCLRRSATGVYTLSPNTERFLVQSSRQYYGDYLRYQMGRQFYHRMGALPDVMTTGEAPSYASWFSDPAVAQT